MISYISKAKCRTSLNQWEPNKIPVLSDLKGERVYCDLIAEWQMILFHHLKFLKIAISDNHVKTMFFFRIFLNTVSDLEARVNGGYNDKPNCRYLFYKLSVDNSIYPESP